MPKFFITTPIYYVNSKPTIGNAYSAIAPDVLARWYRHQGYDVLFTTGTDENSQKTVESAQAAGADVAKYTEDMAVIWQSTWDKLGISYDRFIRTTEPDHKKSVYEVIKRVQSAGDIASGEYEGLYCVGCEEFKRESELVDGKCPLHDRIPEKRQETNYFFKLSRYQEQLIEHIEKNPNFIEPQSRRNEVLAFIKGGLEDISISRQHGKWGIDWPGDSTQKVYVWFDALVNYLTVTGFPADGYDKWWPADVHVVGKDITKFHCVYWPAMLLSAGLPLPKTVFGHGFFTIDGQKISKSLKNSVDPIELAGNYGIDALRYFLLREIPFGADGEFSQHRFKQVYESDLANELGNGVQRVASMVTKYLGGTIGNVTPAAHDTGNVREAMSALRFDKALEEIWIHVKGVNQFIEDERPWELAKKGDDQVSIVLQQAVADLLHVAILIMPFMPATAERIIKTFEDGKVDPKIGILFPKFEETPR